LHTSLVPLTTIIQLIGEITLSEIGIRQIGFAELAIVGFGESAPLRTNGNLAEKIRLALSDAGDCAPSVEVRPLRKIVTTSSSATFW
jgi:hypothetical protein